MKHIGIIVALKAELNIDKSLITNWRTEIVNGLEVNYFNYLDQSFTLVYSGVGKTNAAFTTAWMISTFRFDLLINIGSAGSVSNKAKVSDIVLSNNLYYLDVDATCFGYKLGQVPREKPFFKTDKKLIANVKKTIKQLGYNVLVENTATSDVFISKVNVNNYPLIKKANIVATDMEATSIIQVANKFKIKTLFIKIISDAINEKNSSLKWLSEVENIKQHSFDLLLKVIKNLI